MIDAPSSTWFTVAPQWGWLIVLYFFFGSLAGGCYFLAALIDVFGARQDRPLARLGYYAVMPCLAICGVLLILDLSRPERFWHMFVETHTLLPMFKYWSPMSTGAWALPVFGCFAVLSFLGALAESALPSWRLAQRFRPPGIIGRMICAVGALLALYVAVYTGVLLAVTNRPIWADTPLIGMLFAVSTISISAALMVLLGRRSRRPLPGVLALHRMGRWVIPLEFLVLVALAVSLGPALQGWLNAWGLLLLIGVVATGTVVPLILHRRGGARSMTAVAALVLVSGFILRTVIVLSSESI